MSETTKQWIHGCAIGCGGLAIFAIFLVVGLTVSMRGAFRDAHDDRRLLAQEFGPASDYTPAVDGAVDPERVEVFLTVREGLSGIRAEIERIDGEMGEFDRIGDGEEPSVREALPAVARLTTAMMGLPKLFGEFERTRNRILVESGMGLGEYTYIYVMAYHDQLVAPEGETRLFGSSAVNERVGGDLRAMLRRQLEAAPRGADLDEGSRISILAAELEKLEEDRQRFPYEDGLPEPIAASFEPFRERLDSTYSGAMAELELLNSEVKKGGLTIEMR